MMYCTLAILRGYFLLLSQLAFKYSLKVCCITYSLRKYVGNGGISKAF